MEHTLRCNSLKCRKELGDHAVVTTCSHVFCIDCSNRCQLSDQREGQRPICPACDMHLTNPDDFVVAMLNPTEDYKTSVLSGLSPNVIMECAGRALSFWAYQTTQEIVYQEYLAKNLTDKYASLNTQMDKLVHDANTEITNLLNKMSGMQVDQDNLRRKNEELTQAYREKARKQLQTQELYDKLKRRAMLGQVQNAAHDAVDETIHASVKANRLADSGISQDQRPTVSPIFANGQRNVDHPSGAMHSGAMGPPSTGNGTNGGEIWAGQRRDGGQGNFHQNQPIPISTPSTHRQRLVPGNSPTFRIEVTNPQSNGTSSTPILQRRSPTGRQPLFNLNGNMTAGSEFAGYGMSAGLKVSNPTGAGANGFERPVLRSRVAQRSASGFLANRNAAFGPPVSNVLPTDNLYY